MKKYSILFVFAAALAACSHGNVMSWYAAVCFATSPDCSQAGGDALPAFCHLIDFAIENNDRELLTHLVENIQEMITDIGMPVAALQLLKRIMSKFTTIEQVNEFDKAPSHRGVYLSLE